jgi:hypothetical protein
MISNDKVCSYDLCTIRKAFEKISCILSSNELLTVNSTDSRTVIWGFSYVNKIRIYQKVEALNLLIRPTTKDDQGITIFGNFLGNQFLLKCVD